MIGLIYPLSGPTASAGIDEKHVYELFADMVNGKEPMIPGAFYQQLKGLPGHPRRRAAPPGLRGPPGEARHRPGRGRAPHHPGEGARPRGRVAIGRDRDDQPGRGALRHPALQFRVELADAHAARLQVVLPLLAPRRALHAGDVRLPGGLPEEAERQGRDDRHLQRGHPLRDRLGQDAARPRPEGGLQARGRLRLPGEQHVADRRGAEAQGRESRRLVPHLVSVRRHPLHADVPGARLEPEDDPGAERRAHRPEVHRGHRARTPRATCRARRSRRTWSRRTRWRRR